MAFCTLPCGDGRHGLDLKGLRDHATARDARAAPRLCRGLRDWHSRSGEAIESKKSKESNEKRIEKVV